MRFSLVLPTVATLSLGVLACDGRPLTGPDAQAAYARAAARLPVVPAGSLVFVDEQRLPPGQRLDQLDPKQVVRIEVLKGAAAVQLYGEEARDGVVRVYTSRAAQPESPGRR